MSKQLIDLVNQWDAYEDARERTSLPDFCLWYLANQVPEPSYPDDLFDQSPINGLLGKLMGRVSQYDHHYSKRALQTLGLNNVDDIMYLHVIRYLGGAPRKSELIKAMLSEFPSGIEIIRRLTKMGLIEEMPDEQDKRSKRVRLTKPGEEQLNASYAYLHRAGVLMYDPLSPAEKQLLLQLLERLDTFHTEHYNPYQTDTFDALYEKLIPALRSAPVSSEDAPDDDTSV